MQRRSQDPGDPRERNHWELLASLTTRFASEPGLRANYTWSVLHAAPVALRTGRKAVSVLEIGVAGGNGLVALERAAALATDELGVSIDVYGFDTGRGLPRPRDHRDAPFLMEEGDFPMDTGKLTERLTSAQLLLGDVAETVPAFLSSSPAPVGFVSFDVDYYSSTRDALRIFAGDALNLLPRVLCYFDDTHGYPWSEFNGALLAIDEFNREHAERKVAELRGLKYLLPRSEREVRWPEAMYLAHVFDHPAYADYEGTELVKRLDLQGG